LTEGTQPREVVRVPAPLVSHLEFSKRGGRSHAFNATYERGFMVPSRCVSTVWGAASGALMGALLGAGVEGDGFEPVHVPRVRIKVGPVPRGGVGQVTIGF
jgi:hypothetical protein